MKYKLVDTRNWKIKGTEIESDEKTIQTLNYAYALNYSPLRWYKSREIEELEPQ